jgi:hypothetical protein
MDVRCLKFLPAVLVFLSSCAFADTIIVTAADPVRSREIWITANGADSQELAGALQITINSNGQNYYRDTVCVDLFTVIYIGTTYDTQVLLPSQVPGKNMFRVSWLVDSALLPTTGTYWSPLNPSDWAQTPDQGAGLQLAIWDIVHDGGDGFTSGRVRQGSTSHPTDTNVLYWATRYESLSVGQSSNYAYVYFNHNRSTGVEVQMLAGPLFVDDGPKPAPEPQTVLLTGGALLGAGILLRRGRRRR